MTDLMEVIAQQVYAAMPYDGTGTKPPWVLNGNSLMQQAARVMVLTVLSALDAAGYVAVPKEPTPEMIAAGHQQIDWKRGNQDTSIPDHPSQVVQTGELRGGTYCSEDIINAYRAMIGAWP